MAILSKVTYRVNAIPIKSLTQFIKILNFRWKQTKIWSSQNNPEQQEERLKGSHLSF